MPDELDAPTSSDGARSDGSLIRASLVSPSAFAVVFDRHWPAVHRYTTSRLGPAGEDVAAETFRIAFERRETFDVDRSDACPWLLGIATNLLRRHLARADRGRRALLRLRPVQNVDEVDDAIGRAEAELLGPRLAAALEGLSARERDALLLHAWEGLTYAEIAEAMEVPVGTVRSRLHHARARLRTHLEDLR